MVGPETKEKAMKSGTSKLAIIILSLLASTHTFAFNSELACKAMNLAISEQTTGASFPLVKGPTTDIYSCKTSAMSSA